MRRSVMAVVVSGWAAGCAGQTEFGLFTGSLYDGQAQAELWVGPRAGEPADVYEYRGQITLGGKGVAFVLGEGRDTTEPGLEVFRFWYDDEVWVYGANVIDAARDLKRGKPTKGCWGFEGADPVVDAADHDDLRNPCIAAWESLYIEEEDAWSVAFVESSFLQMLHNTDGANTEGLGDRLTRVE